MRRAIPVLLAVMLVLAACASGGEAEEGPRGDGAARGRAARSAGVTLKQVGRFDGPVYVTAAPGDNRRLYVVEAVGRIVVVRDGRKRAAPFLDIRHQVLSGGEQGLLSVAFAPDFATSRLFYVYFTAQDGSQNVVEYRAASRDRAAAGSARRVLRMEDDEGNHNGGLMLFGPDRLLYIGTGDGGGAYDRHGRRGNAQDLGSLLGKILRIDPRASGGRPYSVPDGNPFVGRRGARPEVYSYGLRNPWRFSFDRRTGDLVIGDVGQDLVEEIDIVRRGRGRGANFGWRPWEGRRRAFDEPAPGAIFPAITHRHSAGFCSITGGYVVRDRALRALVGKYVYGDYCREGLMTARLRPGRRAKPRRVPGVDVGSVVSFGEDNRGHVYVVSLAGGVFRLAPR